MASERPPGRYSPVTLPMAQTMSARNIVEKPSVSSPSVRRRSGPPAAVHQQHAEGHHHEAVQRDVGLGQRVLDDVGVAPGGGGTDDEEPEECAEPEYQDRAVEGEAPPGHAQRAGAHGT